MPKNIIGAGFSDFVAKQIDLRQKKNRIAEKDPDTIFYQNANTAFLRLSSGVNIGETDTSNAKKYQLYNLRFDGEPATGYGLGGNTAYGWESNLGYGFVPPPGLISADIKSMNRGSLREANINLLCHSMDQFNIIERLYLRLGYSMLLEWGWSWYFTNSGELKKSYHNVATDDFFFNNKSTYISLLNQIQVDRQNSNGNYDAMLGRIVNYSWNLEKDGSYNITLTMRSVGDVIESIKTNSSLNTADPNIVPGSTTPPGTPLNINANKSTLNNILYQLSTKVSGYYLPDQVTSAYVGNLVSLTPANTSGDDKKTPKEIVKFDFPSLNPDISSTNVGTYNQFYIKLGKLLDIIQNFLVYYSPKQGNQSIMKFNSSRDENFCFTFPTHGSLDPTVCLVPIDEKSANPIVNTGRALGLAAGVTNSYLYDQIEYSWYEIGIFNSNGDLQTIKIWDPNDNSYTGFSQNIIDELNKLPKSVITKATTITKEGINSKNLPLKLSENALNVLKSGISGEDFTNNYKAEWGGDGSRFNGENALTLFDADLGVEYLVKNGLNIEKTITTQTGTFDPQDFLASVRDITVTIKKYSAISQTFYDPTSIVNASTATSTNPNPSNVLIEDLKDTGFRVDGKYIGSTMDIYVNMDFIAKTLDNYIDINTNSISIYDFLSNLMSGIQNAMGCVNNFVVTYDEDNNTVRIIDSTFIPNLDKLKNVKQYFEQPPTKFITHTLDVDQGSFVRDAVVRTKLSNNFATMVTIGAQANGNVVGENATALSKWNVGLYDRIIKEKLDITTINGNAAANAQTTLLNNFTIMQTLYSTINNRGVTTDLIGSSRNAVTDFFRYYIGKLDIPGIGFLPIDLELTMDGLSGIKIYEAYEADTRLLPKNYQNVIQFITTGISHKIQNNDWTTTLNSISGPKYNGVKIGDPNALNLDLSFAFSPLATTNTVQGNLYTWGSIKDGDGVFNFSILAPTGTEPGDNFDWFDKTRTKSKDTSILRRWYDDYLTLDGQTTPPFIQSNPTLYFQTYDLWIENFLKTAGLPVNLATRWFCFVWAARENTAAKYNVLATTFKYNNSTDFNTNSGYPVQNYKTLADGWTANAETIKQKQYYPALYEALKKGDMRPWAIWQYKIGN
jgi:hypothetical protein